MKCFGERFWLQRREQAYRLARIFAAEIPFYKTNWLPRGVSVRKVDSKKRSQFGGGGIRSGLWRFAGSRCLHDKSKAWRWVVVWTEPTQVEQNEGKKNGKSTVTG